MEDLLEVLHPSDADSERFDGQAEGDLIEAEYTSARHAFAPELKYSPFEIGLGRLVKFDKAAEFTGKRALLAEHQAERGASADPVDDDEVTALYRHPDIVEAAVVALPGEDGISIDAFVCRSDGGKGSIIEMKTFCRKELPLYMIPDRFQFRPSLPKTSTDKVDYQALTRGDL